MKPTFSRPVVYQKLNNIHVPVTVIQASHKMKLLKVILLHLLVSSCSAAFGFVRDLVQFNIAGHPVLHKVTSWPFDPDVGARRSRQYQEINGRLGEKAIERLGLGIDGYDQERLAAQQARDEGHLNGIDYLTP